LITVKSGVFSPSKISVSKGEVVSIQLKSEDRAYSFFLPSKDVHVQFDATKPGQVELTFDREGTYPFSSSIYAPGYETTRGTIAVSSTPN
jgi:heme/copper-type cytochrome/quinol oxidase subunit 2